MSVSLGTLDLEASLVLRVLSDDTKQFGLADLEAVETNRAWRYDSHRIFARLWLDKVFWGYGHIGEGSEDLPVSCDHWDA